MADWSLLRTLLADVDDRLTMGWSDLDQLVGGLPRSAYEHSAFWNGHRSGWPGFTTVDVHVGDTVTFVRRGPGQASSRPSPMSAAPSRVRETTGADVVLIGCVKSKLARPAPARDLYTSALFKKQRVYAEESGARWFVLSAEYGLVEPQQIIEPYELHLSSTTPTYRTEWARRVVDELTATIGGLRGKVTEIHAGSSYTDAVRDGLTKAGATVTEPLAGLTIGKRLAWYPPLATVDAVTAAAPPTEAVDELVRQLRRDTDALTPDELLAHGPQGLLVPGLYSWWVDRQGADDLTGGLGERIAPGLIYAGLAGATRSRSGRPSKNTLWGRLSGMHLGARSKFSTFRRSLGSSLAEAHTASGIDEARLTHWMHEHLRVVAIPVEDADALDRLETAVLAELDPPLNLAKMRKTPTRVRLTELRRLHADPRA
jgi:hypothetical protein